MSKEPIKLKLDSEGFSQAVGKALEKLKALPWFDGRAITIPIVPVKMVEVAGGLMFITGITQEEVNRFLETGSIYEQKESTGLMLEPIKFDENELVPFGQSMDFRFYNQLMKDYMLYDPEEGEDSPGPFIEMSRD